jgi:nucleotidyltransferase/DNA polymerase involved in DNA repair
MSTPNSQKAEQGMILHVDGDSFFATCEMSRHPHLWGKAVVVGQERGIVTAMSAAAKKLGITRATPIFQIRKEPLWKDVVILSGHYDLYEMYSDKLYNILCEYFDDVEHYSIDECFAKFEYRTGEHAPSWLRRGLAEGLGEVESIERFVREVKDNVQKRLGITFSFGLAANKVLAKAASKLRKPDGLSIIYPGQEDQYLKDLSVGSIWGIGSRNAEKLRSMNIQTALDFKNYNERVVIDTFAEPIAHIQAELKGKSLSSIHTHHEDQKSLQSTRSFAPATADVSFLHSELSRNIEEACERLRGTEMYAKHLSLFIKTKETETNRIRKYFSLSKELEFYTNSPVEILRAINDEFYGIIQPGYLYKATGVTLHGLRHKEFVPEDLLGGQDQSFDTNSYTDAIDSLQKRFSSELGEHVIQVASSMRSISKRHGEDIKRDAKEPYIWNLPLPYLGLVH